MPRFKKDYISARGVYYDLEKSPFEYKDEFGAVFKFSSQAKLKIFENKVAKKELDFKRERKKLEDMGYKFNESYESNKKRLPEIVYRAMIYK